MGRRIGWRRMLDGLAGLGAVGVGGAWLALRRPEAPLVRLDCGGGGVGTTGRALVALATRAGATAEVAGRIAERMVGSPAGDLRDWPRIKAWAEALAPRLVRTAVPS